MSARAANSQSSEEHKIWMDPDQLDSASATHDLCDVDADVDVRPYQDVYWLLVWAIQLLIFIAVGIWRCYHTAANSLQNAFSPFLSQQAIITCVVILFFSLFLSISFFFLLRRYTSALIWPSLLAMLPILLTGLIWSALINYTRGIISFAIFFFIHLVFMMYISHGKFVALTAAYLHISSLVSYRWPIQLVVLSTGAILLQLMWFIIWLVLCVGLIGSRSSYSAVGFGFLLFFFIFLFYWTQQVLHNVLTYTVSGVMVNWFFKVKHSNKFQQQQHQQQQASPILSSLKHAVSTSFGSIVLSSLFVALVKTICALLRYIFKELTCEVCSCIADCIISSIEHMMQTFNEYAIIYMAMYGGSYYNSAKQAWNLIESKGFDVIMNDILVRILLFVCSIVVGVITGLLSVLVGHVILTQTGVTWRVWLLVGFLLGLVFSYVFVSVIGTLVFAFFVCLADAPAVLSRTKSDVYNFLIPTLMERYDQVDWEALNFHQPDQREDEQPSQQPQQEQMYNKSSQS